MKRYIFITAAVLLVNTVLCGGCAAQTGTKTESRNAENRNAENASTVRADGFKPEFPGETSGQNRQILWDFRKDPDFKPQKFSAAETLAVVKYLFGGEAAPDVAITSRVNGSFTRPNAKETLYFITGCEDQESSRFTTDCPHAAWNSDGWIAVYDGTTPILKIREALGGGIEKVTDVNGDGISELLSFSGYTGMGIINTSASLGQISGNKYQSIRSFRGYVSNCDEGEAAGGGLAAEASVISYAAENNGKMPVFSEAFFKTGCREEGKGDSSWKKITKKEFDEFFDAHS